MVLKWGAALGCAAAMLAAWVPVAFIVNVGFDGAHQRMASIIERGRESAPLLPASRLDAVDFLNPRLVPLVQI